MDATGVWTGVVSYQARACPQEPGSVGRLVTLLGMGRSPVDKPADHAIRVDALVKTAPGKKEVAVRRRVIDGP